MTFTTQDFETFTDMVAMSVQKGLTFESYKDGSFYTIKYTGGF